MSQLNWMCFILLALFIKHFICDFTTLQGPYQYQNKGTYGHPGGVLHSLIHLLGTISAVLLIGTILIISGVDDSKLFLNNLVGILSIEFISHYHMDWATVKICKAANWTPLNSTEYWWMLGIDQFVHYITYLLMAWLLV